MNNLIKINRTMLRAVISSKPKPNIISLLSQPFFRPSSSVVYHHRRIPQQPPPTRSIIMIPYSIRRSLSSFANSSSTTALNNNGNIADPKKNGKGNNNSTNGNDDSKKQKEGKEKRTAGDVFLDHLGTVFLSCIAAILIALFRSSRGSSNKLAIRDALEEASALDPFEIQDLRDANHPIMTSEFLGKVLEELRRQEHEMAGLGDGRIRMGYTEFVSRAMRIMREIRGDEGCTIQLGHMIDRVMLAMVSAQKSGSTIETKKLKIATNEGNSGVIDDDVDDDIDIYLIILSLVMSGPVRDRVGYLFEVMRTMPKSRRDERDGDDSNHDTNDNNEGKGNNDNETEQKRVDEECIVAMIGHLQRSYQLVADTQVRASDDEWFPFQQYRVGNSHELVAGGKEERKNFLSDGALQVSSDGDDSGKTGEDGQRRREGQERGWTCDDFHHLLRSKSVCAWGECYIKKKGLQ